MLKKEGIQHNVLNAKFHELEAEIVAQAGVHGAVDHRHQYGRDVVRISSWMRKPGQQAD